MTTRRTSERRHSVHDFDYVKLPSRSDVRRVVINADAISRLAARCSLNRNGQAVPWGDLPLAAAA